MKKITKNHFYDNCYSAPVRISLFVLKSLTKRFELRIPVIRNSYDSANRSLMLKARSRKKKDKEDHSSCRTVGYPSPLSKILGSIHRGKWGKDKLEDFYAYCQRVPTPLPNLNVLYPVSAVQSTSHCLVTRPLYSTNQIVNHARTLLNRIRITSLTNALHINLESWDYLQKWPEIFSQLIIAKKKKIVTSLY